MSQWTILGGRECFLEKFRNMAIRGTREKNYRKTMKRTEKKNFPEKAREKKKGRKNIT